MVVKNYASTTDAMHPHLPATESYWKRVVRSLFAVVVVGSATPFATKSAHHVIARPVPSSLMRNVRSWKSTGLPVFPEVIDVIATARAVIEINAYLSTLYVGVAEDVMVQTSRVLIGSV
jgi:hypothetical protein